MHVQDEVSMIKPVACPQTMTPIMTTTTHEWTINDHIASLAFIQCVNQLDRI